MNNSSIKLGITAGLIIVLAALSRVLPHPWNFSPVIAIILFSVSIFSNKVVRFAFPVAIILISDWAIHLKTGFGFHSGTANVYFSYILVALVSYFLMKKPNFINVIAGSLLSSLIFFLVTNFAFFYPESPIVNASLGQYPHNFTGIVGSYLAGIPFFKNALIGDLLFTSLFFGTYSVMKNFILKSQVLAKA